MRLEIFLHDKTAQRMTDYYGTARQTVGDHAYILDIVSERTVPQVGSRTASVAAKAQRHSAIAFAGEEVQEVLIPAPSRVPSSVDEKQWRRMRFADTSLVDHLKHAAP